ncbi:FAD:protein FMN transferase [Colwellia hornerae]|uniref:FAD:protein FMN transferase n=1 Tax=Colwellia hornerae TaxID=89402 RepID=A0A5C6QE02_9GAMM|nr:FAD:protein FMN transferase [Colwellia hornerae]TWX51690.1 FAD:protein FMN transferase ApbE [Colwellia hornerae]TWX57478.1 FAD:protein FMN transferase ApbE [Colwellia hornerae]TWX66981.1 FAD:protein FMN transferase ApbE [Colwellia hornerae]
MIKLKVVIIGFMLIFLAGCFPSSDLSKQEMLLQGSTMGTTYNIKVVIENNTVDTKKIHLGIDALLVQLNQEMSTYIADSELSRFNKSTSLAPIKISVGLQRVIKEAIRLGDLSEGTLDVTVGPLVNLWGFGPEYQPDIVPSDEALLLARQRIGLSKLVLIGNKLSKKTPSLYVDLSTIAKGYGVDLVAEYLEEKGINNYLIEIGGEMRLKGFKHTGELWHVAIEKPIQDASGEQRSVYQVIIPKNNAVATSGDYRNYHEANGKRFSHIIDPESGKPINHKLVSVTVIHSSSMTADGLSTAMMVMGEAKAIAFAEKNGIAAYIIAKTEHGFVEQSTVKFMQYLK